MVNNEGGLEEMMSSPLIQALLVAHPCKDYLRDEIITKSMYGVAR